MSLPIFITQDKNFSLLQTNWASALNPLLNNPMSKGIFLAGVPLINGNTVINHLLSRMQQGWILTDINGAANIYRSAPFNGTTLTLNSSAAVTVNLYVY